MATVTPPRWRLVKPRAIQEETAPPHESTAIPRVPLHIFNFQFGGRLVPFADPVLVIQIELEEDEYQSV